MAELGNSQSEVFVVWKVPHDRGPKGVGVTDEQLDELISCFLDGELSQQETLELEARLQSDPEAARRLRVLQEARHALTRSRTFRLPDEFASRVIEAAKQEAIKLDLPSDHPIRLANRQPEISRAAEKSSVMEQSPSVDLAGSAASSAVGSLVMVHSTSHHSRRWSWAYAAAAAALLVAGTWWWRTQDANLNPPSNQLAQENSSAETNSQPKPDTSVTVQEPESIAPADSQLANTNTPALNKAGMETSKSPAELPEKTASKTTLDDSSIATNIPTPAREPNNTAAPIPNADNNIMLKDLASAEGDLESLNVLMVVDVTLTLEAWEGRAFSRILNEYGIRYDRPIVADESLKSALENSKVVSKSGTDSNAANPIVPKTPGDVELVFIQARAARIDNALKDIFERIDEYPSVYFDLSMDGPCQDIVNRLEASTPFENDGEDIFGIATAVQNSKAPNGQDVARSFAGTKPRGAEIPLANRRNKKVPTLDEPVSMNPVSTVLFILRKPEGASGRP